MDSTKYFVKVYFYDGTQPRVYQSFDSRADAEEYVRENEEEFDGPNVEEVVIVERHI